MDFSTSIRTCLNKYATFTGRAGRPEFWWFMLFTMLVSAVTSTIDSAIGTSINAVWWGQDTSFDLFNSLSQLALLLPTAAAATRRLRDADKSFYNFFWMLVPVVGWIILAVQLAGESKASPDNFSI